MLPVDYSLFRSCETFIRMNACLLTGAVKPTILIIIACSKQLLLVTILLIICGNSSLVRIAIQQVN